MVSVKCVAALVSRRTALLPVPKSCSEMDAPMLLPKALRERHAFNLHIAWLVDSASTAYAPEVGLLEVTPLIFYPTLSPEGKRELSTVFAQDHVYSDEGALTWTTETHAQLMMM